MKQGLIGVIVPVYNVEKYIAECIESILAQTYTNFRLILVDDGTPDNAGKICDEYAKKDPRITVIHQENAGVTRARARGVEEANDCEFITFVDGDDALPHSSLYEYHSRTNSNVDIIIGQYEKMHLLQERTIGKKEYIYALIDKTNNAFEAPWGRLFRKELFNNDTFNIPRSIYIGEDTIMNIRLAFCSKKDILEIPIKTYHYNVLGSSLSHSQKESYKYLVGYFHYLKASVPKKQYNEYISVIIKRGIWYWMGPHRYSFREPTKDATTFIEELKKDIKIHHYKLDLYDRIQLFCKSKAIKFVFVKLHIIQNKLKSIYNRMKCTKQ